jgi:hypothetical protein
MLTRVCTHASQQMRLECADMSPRHTATSQHAKPEAKHNNQQKKKQQNDSSKTTTASDKKICTLTSC